MKKNFVFMLSVGLLLVVFLQILSTPHSAMAHATEPIDKPDTLTLLFIGDVMSHLPQVEAAHTDSDTYDYEPCYRFLSPYITSADIAIANMEVPLAGPPYSGYPQFSCPDAMLLQLHQAGVDVFVTANNHACDKGSKGLRRTLEVLNHNQIPHTGTFFDETDKSNNSPLILHKNGYSIALLNYTYGTNGIPSPTPYIVNLLDSDAIRNDLARTKQLHPDYIVVMVHWGIEYQRHQNTKQEDYAQYLYDCGADMVIGSHPHVVQPITLQNRNGQGVPQRITAYSLGNFVSNQRDRYKDGGIIFKCQMVKIPSQKPTITQFEYLPYWVFKGTYADKFQYYIVPAKDAVTRSTAYNIHGSDSLHLIQFYSDTKKLIDSVPESLFYDNFSN